MKAAAALYGSLVARRLFHPPRRRHHRTPADLGLPFEEARTTTSDGVALHLWVLPGRPDRVAVVGHGIGLSKSASIAHAGLLHAEGFTVALFDHRNHGLSGRDRSRTDLSDRFTRDVEATVAYLRTRCPDATTTLVWGFSFSTFPSFYVLGRQDCAVDAVLCDSGPGDALAPLFEGFLDAGAIPVPAPFRRGEARRRLGESCSSRAIDMLAATWPPPPGTGRFATTPMLFLAARQDTIVPPAQVHALAARYPLARAVDVDGAHLQGLKTDPDTYAGHVREFVASLAR